MLISLKLLLLLKHLHSHFTYCQKWVIEIWVSVGRFYGNVSELLKITVPFDYMFFDNSLIINFEMMKFCQGYLVELVCFVLMLKKDLVFYDMILLYCFIAVVSLEFLLSIFFSIL